MTFPFEGSTELPKDDYLFNGWSPKELSDAGIEDDEFEDADEDD